jgi:hypothetical protein
VALVLFVPLGVVDALGSHALETEAEEPSAVEIAGLLAAVVVQVASSTLGEVFYAGVVTSVVTSSLKGAPRPSLGHLVRSIPYLPLIAVDLLFSFGLALSLALLIVPGVVFFARYVLAAPVLEMEGLSAGASFERSRRLARGNSGFLLVLLGGLYLLTDGLTTLLQTGGVWTLGDTFASDWAIAVVVGIVVTPVWAVGLGVVAWDLVRMEQGAPT